MKAAIEEAAIGISNNEGGPFGCVIVKDDEIIGRGHNQVVLKKDPTCHGEISAIRDACKNLDSSIFTAVNFTLPVSRVRCAWAQYRRRFTSIDFPGRVRCAWAQYYGLI